VSIEFEEKGERKQKVGCLIDVAFITS